MKIHFSFQTGYNIVLFLSLNFFKHIKKKKSTIILLNKVLRKIRSPRKICSINSFVLKTSNRNRKVNLDLALFRLSISLGWPFFLLKKKLLVFKIENNFNNFINSFFAVQTAANFFKIHFMDKTQNHC